MSTKKGTKSAPAPGKKPSSAGKPATQTTAATAEKPARKPSVLKPPMDRLLKRARLFDKNVRAMYRTITSLEGEATKDQRETVADVTTNLDQSVKLAKQVLLDLDMLKASGFSPTGGRGGASKEPLAAGTLVAIKEAYFNAALYKSNDFEVVVDAGKQVRIRPVGDARAPQIDVSRSWLEVLETDGDEDAEGGEAGEETDPGVDE